MLKRVGANSEINTCQPFRLHRNWHAETALVIWLKSINKCKLATTITFGSGCGIAARSPSRHCVEEILRKGIKRLNTLCYRNLAKRKGFSIGVITVIEGLGRFERIHAHIAFEPPPEMPLSQFRALATKAFKPSKWIEQRPHMAECWSQVWINYLLKMGQEALVPSCCLMAKHPSA